MLKPVKASFYDDTKIVGFSHFAKDAETMLGARVKEYQIRLPYTIEDSEQVWDAAAKLQLYFTEWIKENMGLTDPRGPQPRVVTIPEAKGEGWTLMLDFYLLAKDIPVGRTVKEALNDPIMFHPRTRRRKLFYKGKTPAYKTTVTLPKSYVKKSAAEAKYKSLILSDAVRIEKGEDERYHARLTFWKLDPVQLPRDVPPEPKENENFDLWGNWKTQEISASTRSGHLFAHVDEGSGVPMGAVPNGKAHTGTA